MQRSGYTFGEQIPQGSGWLTVLGSYYKRPVLHTTAQAAQAELDSHPCRDNPHMHLEVQHVTEHGRFYKITPA